MNEIEMVGMRTLGNTKLLTESRARIGVFASRDTDPAIDIIREQWAMQKGKQRKCIVGTFHSKAEMRPSRKTAPFFQGGGAKKAAACR